MQLKLVGIIAVVALVVSIVALVGTSSVDPIGIPGPPGELGPQGIQGTQGKEGIQGPEGEVGDAGPTGLVGSQGNLGPTGPEGEKGSQGDTGPTGRRGLPGDQGTQGPSGILWGAPITSTGNLPGIPIRGGCGMPISLHPGDRVTFSYTSSSLLICSIRDPYRNTLFECIRTYTDYGSLSGQGAFIAAVGGSYYIHFWNEYQDRPTGEVTWTIYRNLDS